MKSRQNSQQRGSYYGRWCGKYGLKYKRGHPCVSLQRERFTERPSKASWDFTDFHRGEDPFNNCVEQNERQQTRDCCGQNGFRALKSCRDAVFQLWRELENSNKKKEAFLLTFIDYSKAFDSLDWRNSGKFWNLQDARKEYINVIRGLY